MPEVKTKKAVLILSIEAVTFGFGMAVFIPRNTECIVKGTIAVPQMVYVTSQFANHVWCGVGELETLKHQGRNTGKSYLSAPQLIPKVQLEHEGQGWTIQVFPQELEPCSWFYLSTMGAL